LLTVADAGFRAAIADADAVVNLVGILNESGDDGSGRARARRHRRPVIADAAAGVTGCCR
jgi:hypothetical protein